MSSPLLPDREVNVHGAYALVELGVTFQGLHDYLVKSTATQRKKTNLIRVHILLEFRTGC